MTVDDAAKNEPISYGCAQDRVQLKNVKKVHFTLYFTHQKSHFSFLTTYDVGKSTSCTC